MIAGRRRRRVYITSVLEDACEGGGNADDIGET